MLSNLIETKIKEVFKTLNELQMRYEQNEYIYSNGKAEKKLVEEILQDSDIDLTDKETVINLITK